MAEQQLRALKSFKYMTRRLRAGDEVTMSDKHADFWTKIGAAERVKVTRQVQPQAETVETTETAEDAPKPKRKAVRRKKTA